MKSFDINPAAISGKLTSFIKTAIASKGFSKVILGLSGGLDSTVVAYLSAAALGKDNVIGIIMPCGELAPEAVDDAKKVARILKIKTMLVDIKPAVDAYFRKVKTRDSLRRGNKMARERMSVLYDLSQEYKALVIGTSNKTEMPLGYGTIHGDCACAINPVGALYKTQLRILAKFLKVPNCIINKPPSAGLWQGQEDEEEIGYKYIDIDRLLFFMVDKKMNKSQLISQGFKEQFIQDIRNMIIKNKFKSQLPVIAKL